MRARCAANDGVIAHHPSMVVPPCFTAHDLLTLAPLAPLRFRCPSLVGCWAQSAARGSAAYPWVCAAREPHHRRRADPGSGGQWSWGHDGHLGQFQLARGWGLGLTRPVGPATTQEDIVATSSRSQTHSFPRRSSSAPPYPPALRRANATEPTKKDRQSGEQERRVRTPDRASPSGEFPAPEVGAPLSSDAGQTARSSVLPRARDPQDVGARAEPDRTPTYDPVVKYSTTIATCELPDLASRRGMDHIRLD